MTSLGIEFNMPIRNSKYIIKDMSDDVRYEYWIYSTDPLLVQNGKIDIKTTINYKFGGHNMAEVFSAIVKSNCIDYEIKPESQYKIRPSTTFRTLNLTCYAVTKQDVKIPTSQPIAKIILY